MGKITLPESSLFLLFFTANIDTMDSELRSGELTEKEEQFILNCVNKWGFYDDFYSQEQLESAITKYQNIKGGSIDQDDFIEQCAEILLSSPEHRDMTFYLCVKIIFFEGKPTEEMGLYIGKLERILEVKPAVADVCFGIETLNNILYE